MLALVPLKGVVPKVGGVRALISTVSKLLQFKKALALISVTVDGMTIEVKSENPCMAYWAMVVTPSGIIVFLHPAKRVFPLVVFSKMSYSRRLTICYGTNSLSLTESVNVAVKSIMYMMKVTSSLKR